MSRLVVLLLLAAAAHAQPVIRVGAPGEALAANLERSPARSERSDPGDDRGFDVEAPGPDTLFAAPGGTVGFGVRMAETAGRARRLDVGVEVPDRWQALLTRPSVRLDPGASALQLVNVRVAADAAAGDYPVAVRVAGGVEAVVWKVVRVEAVTAVSVLVVGTPRFVASGGAYEATAIMTNEGNAPVDLRVEATSTQRFRVEPDVADVQIPPGGGVELPFRVRTEGRRRAVEDRLIVRVRSGLGSSVLAEGAAVVDVLPMRGAPTTAQTWPLVGTVSAVGYGTSVVPRVGLAGVVPLDAGRRHQLTLDVTDLGQRSESIYAQRSEWQARYVGPGATARVGTGSFLLSPTTSHAAYGVGGEVRLEAQGADLTAQVRRPIIGRASYAPGMTVGVAGGAASPVGRLSLNALLASGGLGGRVVTGRIESTAIPLLDLDAEAGWAGTDSRPVYTVRATTGLGPLQVSAQARRADAHQPGRYTSLASRGLAGRLAVSRHVLARAEWRSTVQDAGRDGALVPSLNESALAAVDATAEVGRLGLSAGASASRRRSVREGQFDRTLDELAARVGASWRGLRGTVEAGGGRAAFGEIGTSRPTLLGRATLGVSGRWGTLTAHVDGTEGSSVWVDRPSRQWSGGATATVRMPGVEVAGSLSRGVYEVDGLDDALPLRDATQTARLEATVGVSGGRQIVIGAADYRSQTFRSTHAQATLRVPIPVPLPYAVEVPRVRGRFVDAATGEGLANVVVSLGGEHVVTGRDGAFTFATGPDGGFLTVDRSTLGADRVPRVALPLHATPDSFVTVEVTRRTRLRGALRLVTILGTGARADTSDAGGVRRAVIEAEGEGQRARTVTDDQGRFLFDDLPLGEYTLRVVRSWLPERHRLEHETIRVTTGDDAEVLWRVVPAVRQMQILNGGALRSGGTIGGRTLTVRPSADSPPPPPAATPASTQPPVDAETPPAPEARPAEGAMAPTAPALEEDPEAPTIEPAPSSPTDGPTRIAEPTGGATTAAVDRPVERAPEAGRLGKLVDASAGDGSPFLSDQRGSKPPRAVSVQVAKARAPVPTSKHRREDVVSGVPLRPRPPSAQQPVVSCRATRRRRDPGAASLER